MGTPIVAAARAAVVSDGILQVRLPPGWSGYVEPGSSGGRAVAWIVFGDFPLPAGVATREGAPHVPPRRVAISVGDFVATDRSIHREPVASLRPPRSLLARGAWWRVRFAGRAVAVNAVFGSTPDPALISRVRRVLTATRRVRR